MNTRKPIGLQVPYRNPAHIIEDQAKRIAELEAQLRQLKDIIRNMDRTALTRRK